ncbi:SH3 domain-containing protein [Hydrogenophaga sp.]|uniref:SH3 domain-containing protein n=1 Tax=Hydrogenophaga sp. TaxID=1904254 RepID=UPI003562EAD2
MFGVATVRPFLIAIALSLASLSSAMAQSMVSVKGSTLNMRSGPSTKTEVLWELKRGYPLKVVKRQGRWLQVRDFEDDSGWVARSLTGSTPHHVVKSRIANVRKGPSTRTRILGKAEYGELLRTKEKKGKWVRVQRPNGQTGWIAKSLLWGW